jgi:hypothetical protein
MKTEQAINRLGYGLALFPLLFLFVFLAYALRVGLAVGHWPAYGNPESWSFGYATHYAILRPWFHVFPIFLFPLITLVYATAAWILFRRFPVRLFAVLGTSTVILLSYMFFDPGHLLDWFLD